MSHQFEEHIKHWFDYQWNSRTTLNEESVLDLLPEKIKAEIAMNVHLNTLRKVSIFQVIQIAFYIVALNNRPNYWPYLCNDEQYFRIKIFLVVTTFSMFT